MRLGQLLSLCERATPARAQNLRPQRRLTRSNMIDNGKWRPPRSCQHNSARGICRRELARCGPGAAPNCLKNAAQSGAHAISAAARLRAPANPMQRRAETLAPPPPPPPARRRHQIEISEGAQSTARPQFGVWRAGSGGRSAELKTWAPNEPREARTLLRHCAKQPPPCKGCASICKGPLIEWNGNEPCASLRGGSCVAKAAAVAAAFAGQIVSAIGTNISDHFQFISAPRCVA